MIRPLSTGVMIEPGFPASDLRLKSESMPVLLGWVSDDGRISSVLTGVHSSGAGFDRPRGFSTLCSNLDFLPVCDVGRPGEFGRGPVTERPSPPKVGGASGRR